MNSEQEGITIRFKQIRKKRIYRDIISQIQSMIEKGELQQGDKLPSEVLLAEMMGVGRPAIREALSALEIMKVVEIRPGEGTFIRDTTKGGFANSVSLLEEEISPFEVLQARKLVESGIAGTAAVEAKPEDLVSLEEIVQKMDQKLTLNEFSMELDREFHIMIGKATHNHILREVAEYLLGVMEQKLWHALTDRNLRIYGRAKKYVEEHRRIYEAIRDRNYEEACLAMREHIEGV